MYIGHNVCIVNDLLDIALTLSEKAKREILIDYFC